MNHGQIVELLIRIHDEMGDISGPIVKGAVEVWPEMDTFNLMWARRGVAMAAQHIREIGASL